MSRLAQDIRYAVRACRRSPLVSILYGVLLKPLPYPDPDALVLVYDTQPACDSCPASFPKYTDWRARNQVFSAVGGSTPAGFVLSGHGDPTQVAAVRATWTLVDVFGVA